MIKVGSDFSGVGAFNQALIKLGKPLRKFSLAIWINTQGRHL
jgi:hypothetical protein